LENNPFSPNLDNHLYGSIRTEEIKSMVLTLRERIGNLPDNKTWHTPIGEWIKEMLKKGVDPDPLITAFDELIQSEKYKSLGENAAIECAS